MNPPNPRLLPYGPAALAKAADVIRGGGLVAVATETVYGLAADATDGVAVAQIYAAKGRPSFNPLIVHVADLAAAELLGVFGAPERALAAAFWPGPLTLVVPLREITPIASLVTAGLATVALRVPAHRAMQGLIAASGRPLAAPSANASGGISPTTARHVASSLGDGVDLILDDGPTPAGVESTIVLGDRILRPGPVTAEMLARFGIGAAADDGAIHAPGALNSHYAPRKPLRLNATEAADPDEWLIGFGPVAGDATLSAGGDLAEAAARLFALLHEGDAGSRARIAVAPVPRHDLGEAINDRLRRAAHR